MGPVCPVGGYENSDFVVFHYLIVLAEKANSSSLEIKFEIQFFRL